VVEHLLRKCKALNSNVSTTKKKKERKKIRSSLKMVDKGFFFLIIASKCFLTVTETPKIDVTLSSDLYGTGVMISIFVIYYFLDSILLWKVNV
jgi:hypothetical protein